MRQGRLLEERKRVSLLCQYYADSKGIWILDWLAIAISTIRSQQPLRSKRPVVYYDQTIRTPYNQTAPYYAP